jgi:tetratricopeptide (TPR) repeat protein
MLKVARDLLIAMPLLCAAFASMAADAPGRTERVPAMREPVYRQLSAAREQADQGNFAKAVETLDRLGAQLELNSYEAAMTWNLYAFVHYAQEDYPRAMDAYREVLRQRPIPESLENAARYSLAQLYVVTEKYGDALKMLKEWFATVDAPNASAFMLLGQVYYQLGNFGEARTAIEKAVRDAEARNETVREGWYLMLRAIHYAAKDYTALAEVLQKLVNAYPKREYWVQLSAVYGELGDEKRQLAALETAHEQRMLEQESEYVMLAQLLISGGVPYKAGKVLEAGLAAGVVKPEANTLRTLADAWVLAKEYGKSVDALREAAKLADSGELDLRLAQVLLEMERHREAAEAARAAIDKGGLDNPETAFVVAGLALYNLDELDAAAEAFERAARNENASPIVNQWREFIDKERERRAMLEESARMLPASVRNAAS